MSTTSSPQHHAAIPFPSVTSLPALILLPGMICDSAVWGPQVKALSKLVNIIIADYKGETNLARMAEAVLKIVPTTALVAGHSMGGRVALELYRMAPERVLGLCLLGTECHARPEGEDGEREDQTRAGLLNVARSQGMDALAKAWIPNLLSSHHLGDTSLTDALTSMFQRHSPEVLSNHIEAGRHRPDSSKMLGDIQCPVLVIAGENDSIRPAPPLLEMANNIKNSSFHEIKNCGHMMTMEAPDTVNSLMMEWVLSVKSTQIY